MWVLLLHFSLLTHRAKEEILRFEFLSCKINGGTKCPHLFYVKINQMLQMICVIVSNGPQPNSNPQQRHGGGHQWRAPAAHHLLLNLKSFTSNNIGEDSDIFFWLYDLREGKSIRLVFLGAYGELP